MTIISIIIFLHLVLAGFFKAKMDYLSDSNSGIKSITDWQKYKVKSNFEYFPVNKSLNYYLGLYKPKYEERFPYSSTILVFLIDSWHMFQFLFLRCIYSTISICLISGIFNVHRWNFLLYIILTFITLPICLSLPFEIFYKNLKSNEKNNIDPRLLWQRFKQFWSRK